MIMKDEIELAFAASGIPQEQKSSYRTTTQNINRIKLSDNIADKIAVGNCNPYSHPETMAHLRTVLNILSTSLEEEVLSIGLYPSNYSLVPYSVIRSNEKYYPIAWKSIVPTPDWVIKYFGTGS